MEPSRAIIAREPLQPGVVNWSLEEVEVNAPKDDEVLVEMYAAGICHTDILLSTVPAGALDIKYPKVVGHEGISPLYSFTFYLSYKPFQPSFLGAGIARAVGTNVKSVAVGDPILLSFYYCSSCMQCEASHPAYCDSFTSKNYVGQQGSMKINAGDEDLWSQFFGQSSFAQYSVVKKSSVLNAKSLIRDLSELKLFAPLGCGLQTGMGTIMNIAQAGPTDVVLISGMGAVGMGALMVRFNPSIKL